MFEQFCPRWAGANMESGHPEVAASSRTGGGGISGPIVPMWVGGDVVIRRIGSEHEGSLKGV